MQVEKGLVLTIRDRLAGAWAVNSPPAVAKISSETAVIVGGRAAACYGDSLSRIGALQTLDFKDSYDILDNLRTGKAGPDHQQTADSPHKAPVAVDIATEEFVHAEI
jgi:hypothetical protein